MTFFRIHDRHQIKKLWKFFNVYDDEGEISGVWLSAKHLYEVSTKAKAIAAAAATAAV